MRLLLCGYGRMGQEIENALIRRGHTLVGRVDPQAPQAEYPDLETVPTDMSVDAAIDFALPRGIVDRVGFYASAGVPAVVGTTGWEQQREQVRRVVEESGSSLLWASNFSIGAQLFLRLTEYAAQLVDPFGDYDLTIHEVHHRMKKDSPSGTALVLADGILRQVERKKRLLVETAHREIEPEELHVTSSRGGANPGEHRVVLDSAADSIELIHRARNRSGFAIGAVVAAEWLVGKSGFFSIEDLLSDILGKA